MWPKETKAQSTIEFAFGMVVVMFLIYGMVQVFRWAGMDLAQRRWVQDSSITVDLSSVPDGDPSAQLTGDYYAALPLGAVYRGAVTTENTSS